MKLTLCVMACLGLISQSVAASTVTSVSCSTPGSPYLVSSTSCYQLGLDGYSRGAVNTTVSLPSTAASAALITASSNASALESSFRGVTATATAISAADIGIIFDTTGALRNGLLEMSFTQDSWTRPVNGYLSESLSVASYSVDPNGSSIRSVWIPIQLGTDFGFEYKESVTAISSALSGLTAGTIDSQISLQAFESNGTTPVQLFDPPGILLTPEPASLGLLITAGIFGAALLIKNRR
jgi:hypothetical protein